MKFEIVQKDLFTVPQGYYLAHCISNDFALGAGIAKQFVQIFNMKEKLIDQYRYGNNYSIDDAGEYIGAALCVDNVFNLVTKERGFHKPTYENLRTALEDMLNDCVEYKITKIAMPKIGCGLDRLEWEQVEEIIKDVFKDTEVDILICEI